jgi:small-conductance mechanosensitive channel
MKGGWAAARAAVLALGLLAGLPAPMAGAQAPAFMDFGRPAAAEAEANRAPDLQAYGAIAESYRAASALDATQQRVKRLRDGLKATLGRAPHIGGDLSAALGAASPGGDPRWFIGLGAFLVLLLAIGRAVATVFAVYASRPVFMAMQKPNPQGYAEKLPVLAARVMLVVVALAINIAVAAIVGSGFYPDDNEIAVQFAILVFASYAAIRLTDTLWRMILAPYLPDYRIPAMGDRAAARLYVWLSAVSALTVVTLASLYWLQRVGLPRETVGLLYIVFIALQATMTLAGGWINRRAIDDAILGGLRRRDATWPAAAAATLWGPALVGYLGVATTAGAYRVIVGADQGPAPLAVAFLVVLASLLVYAGTVFTVERVSRRVRMWRLPPEGAADGGGSATAAQEAALAMRDPRADGGEMGSDDDEGGGPAPAPQRQAVAAAVPGRAQMRSFEDLARRVASLFALGSAIWALAWVWGGPTVFAEGAPLDRVQNVVDILLVGYVLYHGVRIWIDRRLAEEGGEEIELEPGDEGGGASAASRLATLLPLLRNFVLILIAASCAIFAAMELGVNVAPLLGGAGIIGLAIGFGSQTLVRDILSGAFFLADDAFRKGEYIDIGEVKGTVEKISLRSFQLRHHLGALNTVPFGEVKYLTNYSRDWVMMKLPLRLTYDTDPDKVRRLVKKLGERLLQHPEEGRKFMQPLKSQGVYMMEDSAMIIRVKYMTRPGDQWTTRKLVYQEIRDLFAREGIKFAHREVTVRIPELDGERERGLADAERRAVGAAARRAIDGAEEAMGPRAVAVGDDR